MKMLAAALKLSAAEVPMVRCMSLPIPSMIGCITLRWYKMAIRLEKKTIDGRIQNATVKE